MQPDVEGFEAAVAAARHRMAVTRERGRRRKRVAAAVALGNGALALSYAAYVILLGPRWEYTPLVSVGAASLWLGMRSWKAHRPRKTVPDRSVSLVTR